MCALLSAASAARVQRRPRHVATAYRKCACDYSIPVFSPTFTPTRLSGLSRSPPSSHPPLRSGQCAGAHQVLPATHTPGGRAEPAAAGVCAQACVCSRIRAHSHTRIATRTPSHARKVTFTLTPPPHTHTLTHSLTHTHTDSLTHTPSHTHTHTHASQVHRLDLPTGGLLLVAKTTAALRSMAADLAHRRMSKRCGQGRRGAGGAGRGAEEGGGGRGGCAEGRRGGGA